MQQGIYAGLKLLFVVGNVLCFAGGLYLGNITLSAEDINNAQYGVLASFMVSLPAGFALMTIYHHFKAPEVKGLDEHRLERAYAVMMMNARRKRT